MRELGVYNSITSSTRESSSSSIHYLPDDVIVNILILVPADVLYNATRYVCRKWFNIIHTPMFIKEHLLLHSVRSGLFLFHQLGIWCNISGVADLAEPSASVTNKCLPLESKVYASCDGLAVLRFQGKFYVANLVTKQTSTLPSVDDPLRGTRCHSISLVHGPGGTNDYKVVFSYLAGRSSNLQCMYITVGKDLAWKPIICQDLSDLYLRTGLDDVVTIGVGGVVYWVFNEVLPIFALGDDMETYRRLPSPPVFKTRGGSRWDYVRGRGSLSLIVSFIDELVFDVWFLSESGGSCFEWRKEKRVDLRYMSPEFSRRSCIRNPLFGAALVNDGQVLVLKDRIGCYFSHNLKTGKTFEFGTQFICSAGYFADFTYSLVPLTCR